MFKIVQTIFEVIGISKNEFQESISTFGFFIDESACLKKISELELEKQKSEINYKQFKMICGELYEISCQTIAGKSSQKVSDEFFSNLELIERIDNDYSERLKSYDFSGIPFNNNLNNIEKFEFRKVYVYG